MDLGSSGRFEHHGALDGMRGIAIALVVVSHVGGDLPGWTGSGKWLTDHARGGWIGVDIFFVLSGFLITALLLAEHEKHDRIRYGAFFGRRLVRLLPALYALLAVHLLYALVVGIPFGDELRTVGSAIFYVANWFVATDVLKVRYELGHLWSLAVEEQFYLVWPAVVGLILVKLRRVSWLVPAMLGLVIVAIQVHRLRMFETHGWLAPFVRTDTRIDALIVGALAAWLLHHGQLPRRLISAIAWPSVLVLTWCFITARADHRIWFGPGMTLIAISSAGVILGVVGVPSWSVTRAFENRWLRELGRISYAVYLWHVPVLFAVQRHAPDLNVGIRLLLALAITGALAIGSWQFIEQPTRLWRRRFEVAPVVIEGGSRQTSERVIDDRRSLTRILGAVDESGPDAPASAPSLPRGSLDESDKPERSPQRVRNVGAPKSAAPASSRVAFATSMLGHARRQLGLSIDEVADRSGLTRAEVVAIDGDDPDVSFESLARFGRAVGLKFDLGVSNRPQPPSD